MVASIITKGPFGKEDFYGWEGSSTKTFTREDSAKNILTLNKVDWVGVDALQVYGGGVNANDTTLASALTAIGTSQKAILWLAPTTWTISNALNLSAYSNVTLAIPNGALLSVASGKTLTLPSPGNIAASIWQQLFTGSGLIRFSIGGEVFPEWWGIDGVADEVQINAASASLSGATGIGSVKLQAKNYYISTTINYSVPIKGSSKESTYLICSINDGSAAINIGIMDHWYITGIRIVSSTAPSTRNFIGINAQSTSNRFFLADTYVDRGTTGYSITGWQGVIEDARSYSCTTGFNLSQFNGGTIRIDSEADTTGVIFQGVGTQIDGVIQSATTGLILNNSYGIDIAVHFESNGTDLYVGQTAGSSNTCKNINIVGGNLASSSGTGVVLDNVDGFNFSGQQYAGSPISTTSSAKNISFNFRPTFSSGRYIPTPRDNANSIAPCINFFPNPNFVGGLRGYASAVFARCTGSIETGITRDGKSAYRVSAINGQTGNYLHLTMPQNIINLTNGRTNLISAWLYIPAISHYSGSTYLPEIWMQSTGGTGGTVTTPLASKQWISGSWNFFAYELTIPSDATGLAINLSANQTGNVADGTEYVIFSNVTLIPLPCDIKKVMNAEYVSSSQSYYWDGAGLVTYGTTYLTDSNQQGVLGDRIVNTNPSVNAQNMVLREWLCTVAGSPGTWVPQYTSTVTPAT